MTLFFNFGEFTLVTQVIKVTITTLNDVIVGASERSPIVGKNTHAARRGSKFNLITRVTRAYPGPDLLEEIPELGDQC